MCTACVQFAPRVRVVRASRRGSYQHSPGTHAYCFIDVNYTPAAGWPLGQWAWFAMIDAREHAMSALQVAMLVWLLPRARSWLSDRGAHTMTVYWLHQARRDPPPATIPPSVNICGVLCSRCACSSCPPS